MIFTRPIFCSTLFLATLLLALQARPAAAHKVNVFATVDGATIRGEAYARGGGPIRNAAVQFLDPQGKTLGETTTDAAGKFAWTANRATDHRIVLRIGDGHAAEYTVKADELAALKKSSATQPDPAPRNAAPTTPAATPGAPPNASPGNAATSAATPSDAAAGRVASSSNNTPPATPSDDVAGQLRSLQQEVARERAELERFRDELRLRDLLGGVGYIAGVTGLAFYVLGLRRRPSRRTNP